MIWEDLKNNRAVQALICLIACLLAGLATVRYLAPPQWAALTMGGASATGLGIAWLIARKKASAPDSGSEANSPAPGHSERTSHKHDPAKTAPAGFYATAGSERYLIINLRSAGQQNIDDSLTGFLASMERESKGNASKGARCWLEHSEGDLRHSHIGYWFLKDETPSVRASFVEVQVVVTQDMRNEPPVVNSALRALGLRQRRRFDWLRSLWTGNVPQPTRFKGIIVCCPVKPLTKDSTTPLAIDPDLFSSVAIRELRAISVDSQCRFPLYVVATGLEAISEFNGFAEALETSLGPSALDQAIGLSCSDPVRSKASLSEPLADIIRRLSALRPALLHGQQLASQIKLDRIDYDQARLHIEQEAADKLRMDAKHKAAVHSARTYEFPRQLGIYTDGIADFCWKAVTRSVVSGAGPFLRGVFFAGILLPTVDSEPDSVVYGSTSGYRVFGWNLLTQHLVGISSIEDGK